MIHLRQHNTSFRYDNVRSVYCISSLDSIPFNRSNPKRQFYALPYDESGYKYALLGFKHLSSCLRVSDAVENSTILKVELPEFRRVSRLVNLPIIIVLDEEISSEPDNTHDILFLQSR